MGNQKSTLNRRISQLDRALRRQKRDIGREAQEETFNEDLFHHLGSDGGLFFKKDDQEMEKNRSSNNSWGLSRQ
jgi:hypothetical protein